MNGEKLGCVFSSDPLKNLLVEHCVCEKYFIKIDCHLLYFLPIFQHEMLSREKHALEKRLSFSAYQQTVCDRHTSSESAGSDYVLPVSRIQSDTEQHQEFPCPTCLQDFNTETSYMAHIAKCVVD